MLARRIALGLAVVAALLVSSLPAHAGSVKKTVSFELDKWWTLESTDGPVTLHRIQIAKVSGTGFDKSVLFRPGNSEYLETVQIKLEFSNDATRDWDADVRVLWKDAKGDVIDGYNNSENLDSEERHEVQTITLSTLKYGLERAKSVEIDIRYTD